ncbi:ABC transporter permease [Streptomyces sp. NBC_01257]|uniref:ABC transporter permease n=1 Tax=Streptomyces sp. NBC_01257 TaxID=2903799 RepID=UPI002DD98D4A|nr:ABC transporter permease [Streptomyces sp. NBC_01257]WRZ69193.1 ABC transporter permease [Streptomyces sp. NBC_01257]
MTGLLTPGTLTGPARQPHAPDPGPSVREGAGQRVRRSARFLLRRPGLVLSLVLLALVLVSAFFPGVFTSQDPLAGVPRDKLQGPGAGHLFGTDQLGRDLFSRVVHGSSLSLRATVLAVAVGLVGGSLTGLLAGYLGGWVDAVLMRGADVLLSIPNLLLSMAVVTALGFGTVNVAIAVGITSVAGFARIMRSEVLRVRGAVYVEAARASGARWYSVLVRRVLPNASGPVLVYAAVDFGAVVLQVSSLSFLGYGATPPAPEWGALVSGGRDYLATAWWLTALPGLTIAATVLAANRISRALDGEDRKTP